MYINAYIPARLSQDYDPVRWLPSVRVVESVAHHNRVRTPKRPAGILDQWWRMLAATATGGPRSTLQHTKTVCLCSPVAGAHDEDLSAVAGAHFVGCVSDSASSKRGKPCNLKHAMQEPSCSRAMHID